jgi:hypothetical protein
MAIENLRYQKNTLVPETLVKNNGYGMKTLEKSYSLEVHSIYNYVLQLFHYRRKENAKMKKSSSAVVSIILILLSSLGVFIRPAASQSAIVKVDPQLVEYYTRATGEEFTVSVKIMDVENLYGFDMRLRWNTTFLEYVSRSIHVPRDAYLDGVLWNPTLTLADGVNVTSGTYWIAYSSVIPAPSFNGTGTAFTMTFKVKYHPVQPEPDANILLELYSIDLVAEGGDPIPYSGQNGTVILHALPPVSTMVFVEPTVFRKSQGTSFFVNISVEDVVDLYAFDISLYYNTTLLDALSLTEGPFLKSFGGTITIISEIDDFEGKVRFVPSLMGTPTGCNGSGTLFTIAFKSSASAAGSSNLTLQDTELSNYNAEPIEHSLVDGLVTILPVGTITHTVIVGGNEYYFVTISSSAITNFVYDDAQKLISFDATGPEDLIGFTNITIPTALLTLPISDTFIVLFDGHGICYTKAANATHYSLYFTYSHSPHEIEIKRTLVGDLNGDRKVDIFDIVTVAIAYDATTTSSNWNPSADLAAPWGKINIFDVVMVARYYGKTWTP